MSLTDVRLHFPLLIYAVLLSLWHKLLAMSILDQFNSFSALSESVSLQSKGEQEEESNGRNLMLAEERGKSTDNLFDQFDNIEKSPSEEYDRGNPTVPYPSCSTAYQVHTNSVPYGMVKWNNFEGRMVENDPE